MANKYRNGSRRQYYSIATIPDDEVYEWDRDISDTMNYIATYENPPSAGASALIHMILCEGVRAYTAKRARQGDSDAKLRISMNERLQIERKKQAKIKGFLHMCDEIGPIEFEKWAIDASIDPEPILQQYKLGNVFNLQESWADKAQRWLRTIMDDGTPQLSTDIRKLAIGDELISDSDADWGKLRTLASRYNYTSGARGEWQLPLLYKSNICSVV